MGSKRHSWFGVICGITVLVLTALGAGTAEAVSVAWTVDCPNNTVVGPVTVLPVNFTGFVDLNPNVPVVVALLPTANLIRRDNPAAPPGVSTGTLACTLTLGGVTVPFTRSLTLTVGSNGTGDMTVGAAAVAVNLPALGGVTLSAPEVTTVGYDPTIPIIVVPLLINTTALLAAAAIPTLSTWAWMVMVALMLGSAVVFLRRRA